MELRTLVKFGTAIPAVLSTEQATTDDHVGLAAQAEHARYERMILDFETEVRKRRDAMRAEHLENMRAIFGQDSEAAQ